MNLNYFDTKYAILVHDKILEVSGGRSGMHDLGLLESIVSHVQNDTYYPTFCKKITHIVFSVAMNHAFNDGNKRSSIALGAYFLELNGYQLLVGKFFLEMENIVLWVAQKRISKELLHEIIENFITTSEISEETKLKIFETFTE